jgi:hypothetical protein
LVDSNTKRLEYLSRQLLFDVLRRSIGVLEESGFEECRVGRNRIPWAFALHPTIQLPRNVERLKPRVFAGVQGPLQLYGGKE